MNCSLARKRAIAGAIRPLDVAAIVCVIAVLGFLFMMGMSRVKARTLRTSCQGNLLQMAKALALYAKDNNGRLPDCSRANPRYSGAIWPWDINANLVSDLEKGGMTREAFYCPANPEMNDARHWGGGPIRVIGYPVLFRGAGSVSSSTWREKLASAGDAAAAKSELSFDATAALDGDYTQITGAFTDRSNHVLGKRPLGGNILFLDQHVEWRDFANMRVRFTTIGSQGTIQWSF